MTNRNFRTTGLISAAVMAMVVMAPTTAVAFDHGDWRHQGAKNDWRNLGVAAGAVTLYGLLNHNDTLTVLGAAGAIYAGQRYEHDRRSDGRWDSRDRRFESERRPVFVRIRDRDRDESRGRGRFDYRRDGRDDRGRG